MHAAFKCNLGEKIFMQKQLQVLEILLKEFQLDKSITSVLLTGSVAYGAATEDSDLDIIVLCKKDDFVSKEVNGVLVEIHYHKYETLCEKLSTTPMEVYKYIYSKIVFDDGQAAKLLAMAKEQYENYKTPEKEKQGIQYWLSATKSKLLSAISENDHMKLSYLLATNTWKVMEGAWAMNDKPMPPSSLAFYKHDMVQFPLENWFETLLEGSAFERANVMIKIIDIICGDRR